MSGSSEGLGERVLRNKRVPLEKGTKNEIARETSDN
jgi:hypothetical protein